jgi:hypothetical protein
MAMKVRMIYIKIPFCSHGQHLGFWTCSTPIQRQTGAYFPDSEANLAILAG